LSQALEAVEAIEEDAEKASVLTAIALNTANMGQTVRANDILSQALEIANGIEERKSRAVYSPKLL
jgi:Tfp pilus assembly protein FimT